MDVDAAADVADRRAVDAEARHAVVEHPAVLAVVAAQAIVERVRRARLEAGRPDAGAAVEVLRMDRARPAVAEQIVDAAPGVGAPRGTEPVVLLVEAGAPDQDRRRFEQANRVLATRPGRVAATPVVRFGSRWLRLTGHAQSWLLVASTLRNRSNSGGNPHAVSSARWSRPPVRRPRRSQGGRRDASARPRRPSGAGGTWSPCDARPSIPGGRAGGRSARRRADRPGFRRRSSP